VKQMDCSRQVVDAAFGLHPLKAAAFFVELSYSVLPLEDIYPRRAKNCGARVKGR